MIRWKWQHTERMAVRENVNHGFYKKDWKILLIYRGWFSFIPIEALTILCKCNIFQKKRRKKERKNERKEKTTCRLHVYPKDYCIFCTYCYMRKYQSLTLPQLDNESSDKDKSRRKNDTTLNESFIDSILSSGIEHITFVLRFVLDICMK